MDEPRALSDGELARRIAEAGSACGEEDELCRRFLPRVVQYGLRHLKSPAAASDLAQRVLLLTLEKLRGGAVREPERIASFVFGSARVVSQTMLRTRAETEVGALEDVATDPAPGPDHLDRERLARCLEGLSERERSIMILTFYQEESAAEIAGTLELSEANVRVIRHRALHRLRGCLEEGEAA